MKRLPDSGTIVASRGRVDYYLWMGIPVARSWPRKSTQPRQAGEITSSQKFTAYTKMTGGLGSDISDRYKLLQVGLGVTWVDQFRALAGGKPWMTLGG